MALGRQAKILSKSHANAVLELIRRTREPERNKVIFLLSLRAGLRAKEIACLEWSMVTDADGAVTDELRLSDQASKGKSGRVIPLCKELQLSLARLKATQRACTKHVINTERSDQASAATIVNLFSRWFSNAGLKGCSSHSGRRTFITSAARKIATVGGSLRDVQSLAGHTSLATTQRYIDFNEDAKRRIVELL